MPQRPALGFLSRQEGRALPPQEWLISLRLQKASAGKQNRPAHPPLHPQPEPYRPSLPKPSNSFFPSTFDLNALPADQQTSLTIGCAGNPKADPQFDGHDPATGQGCLSSQNGV